MASGFGARFTKHEHECARCGGEDETRIIQRASLASVRDAAAAAGMHHTTHADLAGCHSIDSCIDPIDRSID